MVIPCRDNFNWIFKHVSSNLDFEIKINNIHTKVPINNIHTKVPINNIHTKVPINNIRTKVPINNIHSKVPIAFQPERFKLILLIGKSSHWWFYLISSVLNIFL